MKYPNLILFFLCFSFLYGQNSDTLKHFYLGELIVLGNNEKISLISNTFEINQARMNQLDALSAENALKFSSGIYISRNTRNEAVVNIRGYEQRQILLFYDGVPISLPYDGSIDFSGITTNNLSKINVTKSMPSVVYGANSMGGVINLITYNAFQDELNFNASIHYGEAKSFSLSHTGKYKFISWLVSALDEKSDGFSLPKNFTEQKNENGGLRDNSSYHRQALSLKSTINPIDNLNFSLLFTHNNNPKDLPINIYTNRPRFWKFTEWKKNTFSFNSEYINSNLFNMKLIAYYDTYYNVLNSYDNANFNSQKERYAFTSTYDDYSFGSLLLLTKDDILNGRTKLSINFRQDIHKEQGNINQDFKKFEARTISFGLEQDLNIDESLSFVFGTSYDILQPIFANGGELRNSSNSINPLIGANYQISNDINLYTHLTFKNRFPTLKEFYSELIGTNIANPELKPENSINFEIGTGINFINFVNLKFALYHNRIKDLIYLQNLPDNKRQFQNIGKAEFSGLELSAFTKILNIETDFNYTYLYAENKSPDANTKILDNRPRHLLNLFLHKTYDFGFSWNIETSFVGYIHSTNPDNRIQVRLQDQFLQNIKIAYRLFERIELFLRVNNLYDRYYETEYGFPQPGRQFILGLNLFSSDIKL